MVEEAAEGFSTAVARLQNARELQFLAQEAAAEKSRVEFKRSERKLFEAQHENEDNEIRYEAALHSIELVKKKAMDDALIWYNDPDMPQFYHSIKACANYANVNWHTMDLRL